MPGLNQRGYPRRLHPPPSWSRTSSNVRSPPPRSPAAACTCQTSTSTRLAPRGRRNAPFHQRTRSNQCTGSAATRQLRSRRLKEYGAPFGAIRTRMLSMAGGYVGAPTFCGRSRDRTDDVFEPAPLARNNRGRKAVQGRSGSYRDRTDDIHGVSVALYQLS